MVNCFEKCLKFVESNDLCISYYIFFNLGGFYLILCWNFENFGFVLMSLCKDGFWIWFLIWWLFYVWMF